MMIFICPMANATVDGGSKTKGWAKIVAFSKGAWYAYYTDGASKPIGTGETALATRTTSIPVGSDAIVIASEQVENTAGSVISIASGLDKLQQDNDGGTQTLNEYALQYPIYPNNDSGKCFALLNEFNPTPLNSPEYEVKATASATGMNGEAKMLVLACPPPTPESPPGTGARPGRLLPNPICCKEYLQEN